MEYVEIQNKKANTGKTKKWIQTQAVQYALEKIYKGELKQKINDIGTERVTRFVADWLKIITIQRDNSNEDKKKLKVLEPDDEPFFIYKAADRSDQLEFNIRTHGFNRLTWIESESRYDLNWRVF